MDSNIESIQPPGEQPRNFTKVIISHFPFLSKKIKPIQPTGKQPDGFTQLIGPSNYPLAYLNNPKAACSTVKNLLYYIQHGKWARNPLLIHGKVRTKGVLLTSVNFVEHRQTAVFDRPYTVFTFVRDPGRRIYSSFIEKIWATGNHSIPSTREFLIEKKGYTLAPLESKKIPSILEVQCAFKQFLMFIKSGKGKRVKDAHWTSQYGRIHAVQASDHVNFVGRVETFAEDMKIILKRAGWQKLSIANRRFNEGPKVPYSFEEVIDAEIASLLVELYENDYAAFGYRRPV